jgi:hypothetical protein
VAAAMVRAHSSVSTLTILTVVQPAPGGFIPRDLPDPYAIGAHLQASQAEM